MKKAISLFLCFCLLLSSTALALEPVRADRGFKDAELHWARDYISVCWQTGLMEGVSENVFDTEGTLTVAQCAAVAARLHARLNGREEPARSEPWYQTYMDYMQDLGCALPADPGAACTRQQFFQMIDAVVPEAMLTPINEVGSLPDTKDEAILRFYRAGILTGMDDYGTFRGSLNLTRAECAAMAARIADSSLRLHFRLTRGDGSAAMQCLFVPADTLVMSVGGYDLDAALVTAALTHEFEVYDGRYQLNAHPEYERYFDSWTSDVYAVNFQRYLSEYCGINEYGLTDWSSLDPDTGKTLAQSAYDDALLWLRQHAALRRLAEKYKLSLTEEEQAEVERAVSGNKVEGESRRCFTKAETEDRYFVDKLCTALAPSAEQINALLASGQYLCVEFVRFEKYDLATGEPLNTAQLNLVRAGAKFFAEELNTHISHYFMDYQTRNLTCAYTAPRCTLWNAGSTTHEMWTMLQGLQPLGVSPVVEDEEGIYVYMVANPGADNVLMRDLRQNYGEDLAEQELEKQNRTGAVKLSEAMKNFQPAEFAARVISK
mgnify:CR=1 FL=1